MIDELRELEIIALRDNPAMQNDTDRFRLLSLLHSLDNKYSNLVVSPPPPFPLPSPFPFPLFSLLFIQFNSSFLPSLLFNPFPFPSPPYPPSHSPLSSLHSLLFLHSCVPHRF